MNQVWLTFSPPSLSLSLSVSLSISMFVRLRWSSWSRRLIKQLDKCSWSPATLSYEQCVPLCVHLCVVCMHVYPAAPVRRCCQWSWNRKLLLFTNLSLFCVCPLWIFWYCGLTIFEGSVWEAAPPRALREQEASQDHEQTTAVNIRSCSTANTGT